MITNEAALAGARRFLSSCLCSVLTLCSARGTCPHVAITLLKILMKTDRDLGKRLGIKKNQGKAKKVTVERTHRRLLNYAKRRVPSALAKQIQKFKDLYEKKARREAAEAASRQ